MGSGRREFIMLAGTAAATAAGLNAFERESSRDVRIHVDLDRMHREVNGNDIYANIYAGAEKEGLNELRVDMLEPGEEAWKVLDTEEASQDSAELQAHYSPEFTGEYMFRAVASTDEGDYFSDIDYLEVLE